MIVDAHVHLSGSVYPGDEPRGVMDLLAAMDGAGIDTALVMSLSLADNAPVLAAGRAHPDRLTSFVVPAIGADVDEQLARAVADNHVGGIGEIYLRCGPAQLPQSHLEPVLAVAQSYRLPVVLHTGEFSYTAPAIMEGIAREYPEVKFILAHMGSLAFVLDAIGVAKHCPNVFLETSGMPSAAMLRRSIVECGPERLLFGSDYPYWHPEVERARIEAAELDAGVERMVLGENAARLFEL